MVKVYIGLGSNLDEPLVQLQSAIEQLIDIEGIEFIKTSPFYKSKPMGPQDQPDFINAVLSKSSMSKANFFSVTSFIICSTFSERNALNPHCVSMISPRFGRSLFHK